jgi:hypothetical protein
MAPQRRYGVTLEWKHSTDGVDWEAGREPFYRKFGFLRMTTAMAIFENQQQQLERGYLSEA